MNCNETLALLDAYLDGELDLVRHLEVENHLKTCDACAAAAETGKLAREIMRSGLTRHTASRDLTARIRKSIQTPAAPTAAPVSKKANFPGGKILPWLSGLGALAAVFCFGFFSGESQQQKREFQSELVTAHVRSLMGNHLTDIASTDQHNVKPWFAGKIDFAPPVIDLSEAGFPLVGGRLEELDGHGAIALVYHRRQHTINLFIQPKIPGRPNAGASFQLSGYHAVTWNTDQLSFIAISDVAMGDLEEFARRFRSQ